MEILRTVSLYCEGKEMPFMVIGGHAMNFYGLSRQTGDLDLLTEGSTREKWHDLMRKLKYREGQGDVHFSRFQPDTLAAWPIDIMYVDGTTFGKLAKDAVEVNFGTTIAKAVSAKHLLILKIHALKHYQEHRYMKDYGDVLYLLRNGKVAVNEQELLAI